MSATLNIDNFPSVNLKEQTELTADYVVGSTNLTLRNNQGLTATDSVLIGTPGSEGSEIVSVTSVNANQTDVVVPATKLKHLAYEKLTKLFGTQAKIYRAANVNGSTPADASFTSLATITLEPDQSSTSYTDANGSTDYWYKYTFYNPTSSTETTLGQCPAVRGGGYGTYCSIDDIREESGFKNAPYITDAMIDAKRQAAQAELDSALGGYYTVPFNPVNPFIGDITRRLAAGLLLLEQFGAFDTMNTQNGQKKVDAARADYNKLMAGSMTLKDANGSSIASTTASNGFSGWPNETTTGVREYDDSTGEQIAGSGDFLFRVNDKF